MKLLHIDSSALGAHSVSRDLSAAIVAGWKRREPRLKVHYRDLAAEQLPHWMPVADAAGAVARDGGALLDEFLAADIVVIGAPMYNFSIPSQLKAWIDRIVIAGKTFRYGATGVEGLAGGRKVIIDRHAAASTVLKAAAPNSISRKRICATYSASLASLISNSCAPRASASVPSSAPNR